MAKDPILAFLQRAPQLTAFCTQNGWIDNEGLRYEVLERQGRQLLIKVEFPEVIMEGSGCTAGRIGCYGRLRLTLDESGRVGGATPA